MTDTSTETRARYSGWALVTGGSSGIGRSLARGLAKRGMDVVLVADQGPELETVATEIRSELGVQARTCCVDLARPDFLARVQAATSDIDVSVVINNASFGVVGDFTTRTLADYDTLVAVNVRAYVALTHAYLPPIVAANRGALMFVSSINALSPIGGSAVYTASKAFEFSFGGALWYELRDTAIDVLVVLPGPTRTGFQAKAGTKVAVWAMEPDDVAEGALEALGGGLVYIPGERNQAIAKLAGDMALEQRIVAASEGLRRALVEGVDPQL
jgi:short-subunit dehydrogenase